MQFDINITGLEALAASISDLAEALKAGVTANEVIAKASTRKPRTPAPVAAPAVEPEAGNAPTSGPTDTVTPVTAVSTAPAAETPPVAPEPSTPAVPSEPAADKAPPIVATQAPVQAIPGLGIDENSEEFLTARGLVLTLSKTKGREITLATLAPFGVERISQIKDVATLVAFSAAAQKALV